MKTLEIKRNNKGTHVIIDGVELEDVFGLEVSYKDKDLYPVATIKVEVTDNLTIEL